jgi:ribonuclease-3
VTVGRGRRADELAALETALGHRFADRGLLKLALTHASAGASRLDDNQRLEFLGDRVLSLIVADLLYQRFPREEEGAMARRHAALVRQEALADVARRLGLDRHVRVAGAEGQRRARERVGTLADACEAVIAALYLDGGLAAARDFVAAAWESLIAADHKPPRDAKTALQEWTQARGQPLPRYAIVAREGPDHEPLFTITVTLKDGRQATATGANKRAAETAAAASLLGQIGVAQ